jgi:hypothetical protein
MGSFAAIEVQASTPPCENPGWFPEDFGLKDHSVFYYDGYYYIVSINAYKESYFVYGRSEDLCVWEELPHLLEERPTHTWDSGAIWAPFVYEEGGVYYMFYTGVANDLTQSIMLATSIDPADPNSWLRQGLSFQPNHVGMDWELDRWSDCRDPVLIQVDDIYYLYYTGKDIDGYIIGMATASSLQGPWTDWGALFAPDPNGALESPSVVRAGNGFYLFYNHTTHREVYRYAGSPGGPWSKTYPFGTGWANEVWQDFHNAWYTSYLTDYTVSIAPLFWDEYYLPPRPFIGGERYHIAIPLVIR